MKWPVVASGGVSSLNDLERLKTGFKTSAGTLLGVITGRAIYDGRLDLQEGQAVLDRSGSAPGP